MTPQEMVGQANADADDLEISANLVKFYGGPDTLARQLLTFATELHNRAQDFEASL